MASTSSELSETRPQASRTAKGDVKACHATSSEPRRASAFSGEEGPRKGVEQAVGLVDDRAIHHPHMLCRARHPRVTKCRLPSGAVWP